MGGARIQPMNEPELYKAHKEISKQANTDVVISVEFDRTKH